MKRKTIISFVIVFCLLSSLLSAFATEVEPPEPPIPEEPFVGLISTGGDLNISSSGIATCSGWADLYNGYTAEVTVTLQRRINNRWVKYASWTGSGSSPYVSQSTSSSIPSGYTYRTYVYVAVFDSSNNYIEHGEAWSGTHSYP